MVPYLYTQVKLLKIEFIFKNIDFTKNVTKHLKKHAITLKKTKNQENRQKYEKQENTGKQAR